MADFFTVGTSAKYVSADTDNVKKIHKTGGSALYYKNESDVDSGDTEIATGTPVTISAGQWIVSALSTHVMIEELGKSVSASDVSIADDLSVTDDATVTGTLTVGDITPASTPTGIVNVPITVADTGTNTTPADGTQFVTSIYVPVNKTITNINYLIGDTGGTDKVYGVLYNASGTNLANSSLTSGGATVGTANQIQTLALTSTYAAVGPARYFVGISMNGNTARLNTVAAHTQNGILAGSVAQAHGTVAAITAPSTFTADKAPYVFLN